jgi:hypothetical protein
VKAGWQEAPIQRIAKAEKALPVSTSRKPYKWPSWFKTLLPVKSEPAASDFVVEWDRESDAVGRRSLHRSFAHPRLSSFRPATNGSASRSEDTRDPRIGDGGKSHHRHLTTSPPPAGIFCAGSFRAEKPKRPHLV